MLRWVLLCTDNHITTACLREMRLTCSLPSTSRSARSVTVTYVRAQSTTAAAVPLTTDEERLIHRGDFIGVKSAQMKADLSRRPPESALSLIEESLRRNFRVSGEMLYVDVLKKIEADEKPLIDVLRRGADRWLPTIISCCGYPLSNIHKRNRMLILKRLMCEFDRLSIPLNITSFNRYLAVLLENEAEFDVDAMLKEAEEIRKLELNQFSFQCLLKGVAQTGAHDRARDFVYKMAQRGLTVDSSCNAAIVYCFAVAGHHAKADSLLEQTEGRFGPKAVGPARDAIVRAAASRVDKDANRLRTVLRRSVDEERRLTLSNEALFDTIWLVAERSRTGDGGEYVSLIEQMLEHTNHSPGFFKLLFREVERHISHEHYYTSLALLEDTNRVQDCLHNQQRSLFRSQMLARLSRQLIRSQVPLSKVSVVANRATAMLRRSGASDRIYDDLLYAALTYRDFGADEKFEYLSAFVDVVDRGRERPHLMLPILSSLETTEQRLKIMFRCSALGYRDASQLDTNVFVKLVLQPLYDRQRPMRRRGESFTRLDETARVLKSYANTDDVVWRTFQEWRKLKIATEKGLPPEAHSRPHIDELAGWLREKYYVIYQTNTPVSNVNAFQPTFEKLQSFVESGDSTKVNKFLVSYGWPDSTNYEEIVPKILDLYLENEEWSNVQKMLTQLSAQANEWVREDGSTYSPIKNFHLLRILRRRLADYFATSANVDGIRQLIDYAYELRRLFPNATANYETFFETLYEYNRLFSKCFESSSGGLTVDRVDECIELLRTILKLNLISLHPSETLTITIVGNVLRRLGWEEAVNTWMKFQSGFYCSNGIVALLRHAVHGSAVDREKSMMNVQYLIHKAQNFVTASHVHAIYAAVLVSMRRLDVAETYLEANSGAIEPTDVVTAVRLINAMRYRQTDEEFIYNFCRLALEKTRIATSEEACRALQTDWLRLCETKKLGGFGLRMYELFTDHAIKLPDEEMVRLQRMAEQQATLAKKWIFNPSGLLKISEDDPIVTSSDAWRIQQKLRQQVATSL